MSTRPTAAPFGSVTLMTMRPACGTTNRTAPTTSAATNPIRPQRAVGLWPGRRSAVASMLRSGGWLDMPPGRAGGNVEPGEGRAFSGGLEIDTAGGGGRDRDRVEPNPESIAGGGGGRVPRPGG